MKDKFIDKLIDWQEFEKFVQRLYKEDPNLIVEHNVMLVGNSGAKYQIDVLITHNSKSITNKTIVECKRWKKKVNRQVVNVLYAAMEDLNATHGIIFTTEGYESGAKKYAKSKNIEIFKIRELKPEEWGKPGRSIKFYFHYFFTNIKNLKFPNAKIKTITPHLLPKRGLNIDFKKEFAEDDSYRLYSKKNKLGPNLFVLIGEQIIKTQKAISEKIGVFENGEKKSIIVESEVEIDFTNYEYAILELGYGELTIAKINFHLTTLIDQSLFQHDRGEKFNLVLAVENYITQQIDIISQETNDSEIITQRIIEDSEKRKITKDEDILKNGSIMNLFMDPWKPVELSGKEKVIKTNRIVINL